MVEQSTSSVCARFVYTILLALPLMSIVIWVLGLRVAYEALGLGAYKHYFQTRLQRLVQELRATERLITWEEEAGTAVWRSRANVGAVSVFALLTIATAAISFYIEWAELPHIRPWVAVDAAIFLVMALFVVSMGRDLVRFWNRLNEDLLMRPADSQSSLGDTNRAGASG